MGDGITVRISYRKASPISQAQMMRKALKMIQDRERAGEADAA